MIISRSLSNHIAELSKYYPIISLTGPRQAGKTTLLSELFPDYRYVSLEALDIREEATEDTRGFLNKYDHRVIFDEAQRVPALFNYLQGVVDENREPGRFILSGSQNFLLHRGITQSLAGRVGIARLFPLDFGELAVADLLPSDPGSAMLKGFYPNSYSTGTPARYFYPDYVSSYLERDVNEFINTSNLTTFLQFLQVCAHHAGQLINLSRLSSMVGVSTKTITAWLSILEMSYIVFRIGPYFKNFGKRITKSPKLYFYDTGLLCHLLGVKDIADLKRTNHYGAVFENLIIADRMKTLYHAGERPQLHFFRDQNGLEADLLEGSAVRISLTEIKFSETFSARWDNNIRKIGALSDVPVDYSIIYAGNEPERVVSGTRIVPWYSAGSF